MSRVIVGISGGVDSAVTAWLLKAAGHDVIGVTLRTWVRGDGQESRCCEIDDARDCADRLGIPYYVIDRAGAFREKVVAPWAREYALGRTPNPCVDCNRVLKWDGLLQAADDLGARYVATGHYARVIRRDNGRYTVQTADSAARDQTYMLYRLTQEQLSRTLMPLGGLDKAEVRRIAAAAGLSVAHKADSQEICFVTEGNYADFIETATEQEVPPPGNFVDEQGRILGRHRGILHYTVGQRKHLGLSLGHPVFVKQIRPETDEIVIADDSALYDSEVWCDDLNYMSVEEPAPGTAIPALVKIRYQHPGGTAVVEQMPGGRAVIRFDRPVRAAAPGQSAVFYDSEGCVIGGGKIYDARKSGRV